MVSFRGEEQPGFRDLVGTWLSQQTWFQAAPGRRVITRVGGLRLPASHGDPDHGLYLELHIFHVDHAGGQARVAMPMALRTRPSALAGKTAFIGRLSAPAGDLWVYDGARDRAFLAAWHEMARREQGSRNGRSRGEAVADFASWPAFTAKLQRTPLDSPKTAVVRTAVISEGADGETAKTVVDFIRRPEPQRAASLDTVLRMSRNGSHTVARVLGVVTGSWPEANPSTGDRRWITGDLGTIREASIAGTPASALVRIALREESDFLTQSLQLGRVLGDFHADLAATFGAHPQTSPQCKSMNDEAADALETAWRQAREGLDEPDATQLAREVEVLSGALRDADQPMNLQKIHGALTLDRIREADQDAGWIIDEDGGMQDQALPLHDVVSVLISLAELVMESDQRNVGTADADPATHGADRGRWYEQVTEAVLTGYQRSDAPDRSLDSSAFRAAMLTAALELFRRRDARWIFTPSMLRPRES